MLLDTYCEILKHFFIFIQKIPVYSFINSWYLNWAAHPYFVEQDWAAGHELHRWGSWCESQADSKGQEPDWIIS